MIRAKYLSTKYFHATSYVSLIVLHAFFWLLPPSVYAQNDTKAPSLQFDATFHDFGEMHQGDVVKHIFKFTNSGKQPLTITHLATTCGCTAPEWPRQPIAPGETGEIVVQFDSSAKFGIQQKSITLFSNGNPSRLPLKIRANVLPPKG